jgi:hypothetical protein
LGGVRDLTAGPRIEARLVGGSLASVWAAGEYMLPLAGDRTAGAALTAELAHALRLTVRAHRVPARDAWLFELGGGIDLRYFTGGYVPRAPAPVAVQPPNASPTFFDLLRSESAAASAPLSAPESSALRDAVWRQLDHMRRQPDTSALLRTLRDAGLDRVAGWMETAFARASQDALSNRPPIEPPPPGAEAMRSVVQALVDGIAQNVCANG